MVEQEGAPHEDAPDGQEQARAQEFLDEAIADDRASDLIPEGWINDISEAQKEAYRIKVLAKEEKAARDFLLGIQNGKEVDPNAKKEDPTADDYKHAEGLYRLILENKFVPIDPELGLENFLGPLGEGIDYMQAKIQQVIGGNGLKLFLELSARLLARKERKALDKKTKK
jgi:hypothetical protein